MKTKVQIRVSRDGDWINYHFRKNGKEVSETALSVEERHELGDALLGLALQFGFTENLRMRIQDGIRME